MEELISKGIDVLQVPTDFSGKLNIKEMVFKLPSMGIHYLLVEGGPRVLSSFLRQTFVTKWHCFMRPRL